MPDQLFDRLVAVIAPLAPHPDAPLTPDADLVDDLGFDSLALIELTVAIEEAFGLAPVAEFEQTTARTIGAVAAIVARAVAEQRP